MTRAFPRTILLALVPACALAAGGCNIVGGVAAIAAAEEKTGNHEVLAQYSGLAGKSFAVVVAADRSIQADYPELIPRLCEQISEKIAAGAGASAYVPPLEVLAYQYNNPRWVAMSPGQIASALGVQRLVYVDMVTYRLNDPGNQYTWEGIASGTLGVAEADSSFPDELAFSRSIKVTFPDQSNVSSTDMARALVHSELTRRYAQRCAWAFFKHEEPNRIKY